MSGLNHHVRNTTCLTEKITLRKPLFIVVTLLFLSQFTSTVVAQTDNPKPIPVETYNFNQVSIATGLLDNEILDIIQDRAGFIWIASAQGLIRYDGATFHNFHHNVKVPAFEGHGFTQSSWLSR